EKPRDRRSRHIGFSRNGPNAGREPLRFLNALAHGPVTRLLSAAIIKQEPEGNQKNVAQRCATPTISAIDRIRKRIEDMNKPYGVGISGAGDISASCLRWSRLFGNFEVRAVASRTLASAQARGQEFGIDALSLEA